MKVNVLKPPYTMTVVMSFFILVMGLIGLLLALMTGALYKDLTLNTQKEALHDRLQKETDRGLQDLKQYSLKFAFVLQQSEDFRAAFLQNDSDVLNRKLHDQFFSAYATSGVLKLFKLEVYDLDIELIAQAENPKNSVAISGKDCGDYIGQLKRRRGKTRKEIGDYLCDIDQHPVMIVTVPIDETQPKGYVSIFTSPTYSLEPLDEKLAMPVRLMSSGGNVLYQSEKWPENESARKLIVDNPVLLSNGQRAAFKIAIAEDLGALYQALEAARIKVILLTTISTLLAVIVLSTILKKRIVGPLLKLTKYAHVVGQDKEKLGIQIDIKGVREVNELASSFNTMGLELKQLYTSLETIAYTDALTKLANRKRFHDILDQLVKLNRRQKIPFVLMFIDLDKFKMINDTLGHNAGDELLQQVSTRIGDTLRETDTIVPLVQSNAVEPSDNNVVARLGGDEFAIILPGVEDAANAEIVARKLLSVIATPFMLAGSAHEIGMSIGVALFPQHGENETDIVHHADLAMYFAKKNKTGYRIYDETLLSYAKS